MWLSYWETSKDESRQGDRDDLGRSRRNVQGSSLHCSEAERLDNEGVLCSESILKVPITSRK